MNKWLIALMSLAFFGGCFFLPSKPFEISFETPLPRPQAFLSSDLKTTNPAFDLEYKLATSCLYEYNLSPTIYGFKKALAIASTKEEKSLSQYGLIYTYFLAKKFHELKALYLSRSLENLDPSAPYFKDALVMFYIAFQELKLPFVKFELEKLLSQDPQFLKSSLNYKAILSSDFKDSSYEDIYKQFKAQKKSESLAASLNLILPGSGYLYLSQKQSALTAFLLISLLGLSLYKTCQQKQLGLSFILFSVFTGFYWGSLVGVKEATQFYNKKLYRYYFQPVLEKEALYPELLIHHAP